MAYQVQIFLRSNEYFNFIHSIISAILDHQKYSISNKGFHM